MEQQQDAKGTAAIARKICAVMADVGVVPKEGTNTFHKYTYQKWDHIKGAIQRALIEHKLAIVLDVKSVNVQQEERQQRSGTKLLTTIEADVVLIDGDSGATLRVHAVGMASDTDDKGAAKATTALLKKFILDTFFVPSEDDAAYDTDATPAPARQASQAPASRQAANGSRQASNGNGRKSTLEDYRKRWATLWNQAKALGLKVEAVKSGGDAKAEMAMLKERGLALRAEIDSAIDGIFAEARELEIPIPALADDAGPDERFDVAVKLAKQIAALEKEVRGADDLG